MQDRVAQGEPVADEIYADLRRQPRATEEQQRRWDWVRSIYLVILMALFVGVVAFACYSNQFGDWAKAKELLGILLPALAALIAVGTAFYFKHPQQ
jgi:uncharacterized membrane protein YoaK (UPF0700 family)